MNSKEKYKLLCSVESSIPLFSQYWWMDAVCGRSNWDVIIIEKNNKIIASLPYYFKLMFDKKIIMQPLLTQTNGVWINYPLFKNEGEKLSYEKQIVFQITEQLDRLGLLYFDQNFHYSFTNWLPFYWKDYQQTTRYTYVIDDISDPQKVYESFIYSKKKNIKKAERIVNVKYDLSAKDFYENHKMTLEKQGEKIIYSYKLFKKIYSESYKRKQGKTIYAVDKSKNIHCALFIVWTSESAYDLISTIDPEFRDSGASSLLIYRMIQYLSKKTKKFDFEGSMYESIESSFRQFGSSQKPYFNIYKGNILFRILQDTIRKNHKLFHIIRNIF